MTRAMFLVGWMAMSLVMGCGSSQDETGSAESSEATPSSGNPLTAPADYLGTVAKGQQSVSKTASTVGLNQAIQLFQAQEGRTPKSLNELVPTYISRLPEPPAGMKFDYNPSTGELKVVPQ